MPGVSSVPAHWGEDYSEADFAAGLPIGEEGGVQMVTRDISPNGRKRGDIVHI